MLSSFVSRNNDVDGYWALGKLYKHATEANTSRVCIDLLDSTITPQSEGFAAMAKRFQEMLRTQLVARRLPAHWVQGATVCVEFSGIKSLEAPGEAFKSTMVITDERGKTHSAAASGACWIHDPHKEFRSTRA